jgi:hypothetical protein
MCCFHTVIGVEYGGIVKFNSVGSLYHTVRRDRIYLIYNDVAGQKPAGRPDLYNLGRSLSRKLKVSKKIV